MAYFKIKGQSASAGYATGEYGGPRTDIIEAADRDGALEAAVRSGFYRKGLLNCAAASGPVTRKRAASWPKSARSTRTTARRPGWRP